MSVELIVAISSLAGTIIVGVGLVKTWQRNGSQQKQRDLELARLQAARDERIDNALRGVQKDITENLKYTTDLDKKIDHMRESCATNVATFKGSCDDH